MGGHGAPGGVQPVVPEYTAPPGLPPREVHGGPPRAGEDPPGSPPVVLDLSTNVNPRGPCPAVREAIRSADAGAYPDPESWAPRRAAARVWGIPPEEILFGAGAAELLHVAVRATVSPGDVVLLPTPSFGEYARAVRLVGGHVRSLPCEGADLRVPLERFVQSVRALRPRLVILCHPHAPTGESLHREVLARVVAALPPGGFLLLDESYRTFADGAFLPPLFAGDGQVIHLRSLTKDFALAGVRAGFVSGRREVLDAVDRIRVPWSASTPAQVAAAAALSAAGLSAMERTLPLLAADRTLVRQALQDRGWEVIASAAPFLLSRVPGAAAVWSGLRRQGIRVRDCTSFGLPDHLRIGIPAAEGRMDLLDALDHLSASPHSRPV